MRRLGDAAPVSMTEGRDVWWHDIVERQAADCPPVPLPAEHMLYLLYTSGTTAKPKGIMHTTAGYLLGTSYTHRMVFDIKPDDVYWCAADIGWVTGHSYIVYGPLANATTGVLYEGAPDTPSWERWWQIVEDYKVSVLYMAPTAIRAFMKQGEALPAKHDLSSLRLLGSVGEPINPEAWLWYQEHIGGGPLPDRRHLVADRDRADPHHAAAGRHGDAAGHRRRSRSRASRRTSSMRPARACRSERAATSCSSGPGRRCSAASTAIPERYRATYWSRFPGMYFAGDGAKRDVDGYFWLLGRVDDVMNVAGHRISTIEVESALVDHKSVAEAAVVGKHDPVSGEAIFAFVIVRAGIETSDELGTELREHVAKVIGADRPAEVPAVHVGPAEDPLRQDHAAAPARRRRGARPGRHDDAGRCGRRGHDPRRGRRSGRGLTRWRWPPDPSRR